MIAKTDTGETVDLSRPENVRRGMVFRGGNGDTAVLLAHQTQGLWSVEGWPAREWTPPCGGYWNAFLGMAPAHADRADCERFGIAPGIDAGAHGFARTREGFAVDLRKGLPIGSVFVRRYETGDEDTESERVTYRGSPVPRLHENERFVGLDRRHARPEDVERLCCREAPPPDGIHVQGCTLAIGHDGEHEDLATGARWEATPLAPPAGWPDFVAVGEVTEWVRRATTPVAFATSLHEWAVATVYASRVWSDVLAQPTEQEIERTEREMVERHRAIVTFGQGLGVVSQVFDVADVGRTQEGSRLFAVTARINVFADGDAPLTKAMHAAVTGGEEVRIGLNGETIRALVLEARSELDPRGRHLKVDLRLGEVRSQKSLDERVEEDIWRHAAVRLLTWIFGLWDAEEKAAANRRAKEAALVALVNAVPEGLDPVGWRSAVLCLAEERWERDISLPASYLTERLQSPMLGDENIPAVAAYRRAIAPHKAPPPERKRRGLPVDDGRDE